MPNEYKTFQKLRQAGIIPLELMAIATKLRPMKSIPTDVQAVLTEDQARTVAKNRYDLCLRFQTLLEEFYLKHYYKSIETQRKKEGKLMTDNPLELAYVNLGHNGNRTLWHVNKMLEEDKPRMALIHIDDLPDTFIALEKVFIGTNPEVDVRPYFKELFEGEL
jgi:hypothetical protein